MFQPTQQKLVDLSHFQEGPGGILSRGSDILLHLSFNRPFPEEEALRPQKMRQSCDYSCSAVKAHLRYDRKHACNIFLS